jgi:hypothetical protein
MYPFTLEEVHAGWTKGKERIITKKSGVYGWRGDRQLHRVHRSDARGVLVPNEDFSTANATEVRTELRLAESESAVVEKIPVELLTERPVNVLAKKYDSNGLKVLINGKGDVRLRIANGDFRIEGGETYAVDQDESAQEQLRAGHALVVPLKLDGATLVRISRT